MKKLILSFVMLMAAVGAWAEYYAIVDGVRYATESWYDYAYVVAPESGTYTGEITIQSSVTFDGLDYNPTRPVKQINPNAFEGSTITKVTIPASVEEILDYAFRDCAQLTTVIMNEGLKKINSEVFKNCTSLTSITLPEGLQDIGSNSFEASGLTSITLPGSLAYLRYAAFKDCTSLTSITMAYTPLESLPDDGWFSSDMKGILVSDGSVFSGCTSLTDVTINRNWYPNTYNRPFENLNVKHVTIGDHVTAITEKTLQCVNFESLSIGTGVTEIGNYAFEEATLPTGYAFPFSQIKKIGSSAFKNCKNLPATVNLSQVEEIGSEAFQNCEDITSLTIGGGTIDYYAFYGCSNIATITLNEGVTEIGSSNFQDLTNLTTVNIPSTMKKIGSGAFYNCTNLTIPSDLPNGLEEIGSNAFYNCKKLNVHIPATVTRIEQGAFYCCESLTEVTIPAGITALEGSTFSGCTGLTTITIPGNVTYIGYYDLEGCTNLTEVNFEKGESTLRIGSDGYAFYNSPCTTLYINRNIKADRGYNFRDTENVTFGPDCTEIGEKLFDGSTNLKKVTMTDNIKSIGWDAFSSAKVKDEFTLSQKLETIGTCAFSYFQGFTSFTFPITVSQIGDAAFYRGSYSDEKLKDVYVPWLTPLALDDDDPGSSQTMFDYTNQTLWVPGGTMDAYKAATIWKKFQNFDYWSFVVNAAVAGKGSLKLSNGEAVTDNGTNTEKTASNNKLVAEGAGEAAGGLFVREKDLVLTPTPARGYELSALTANTTDVKAALKVENLLADQTIAAEFTPIIYTITYNNLQNGVLPEGYPTTYTVEDNDITLPQPTRTAYNFMGWTGTDLTEPTMTVVIPAGSIENREYTAVWEPIVYPITYDLAGGNVASANPVEYTIETPNFTLTNPTKLGYTFTGWEGTDLTEKTLEVTVTTGHYGNRSYTATWEPNPYKVHFDINGGDGTETMADMDFLYDAAQNLTANAFTRTGYTFKEWNSKADGTGTVYTDGQEVMNLTAERDAVVTMYAQWTPNPYQVRFNANNGEGTMANQNFTYDVEQALTENAFTRTGYTFAGWNTAADGSGTAYADKASVKNLTAELNGIFDVYAQWQVITYTISYDLAGGSVATDNPVEYTIETADFTLTNPTREGYEFTGWEGTGLDAATTTVTIAQGNHGDRTYTATWTPIVYNITYDLAGGSVTGNPATYTIETPTFTLNNPTKEHYVFAGWTGTGLSAATMTVQIAVGNTGDRSYTATWERETYTVSIQSNLTGMVTASTTSPKYEDDVVLTIADDEDFELLSLTVDGVDVTSQIVGGKYTITSVQANVTVVATYNATKAFITMAHSQQTFSCTQPLDFTNTGLKAYIASGFNNGVVLLTRVDVVPANTGLFLVGTEGQEYKVPFTANNSFYSNLLKPVTTAQVIPTTEGEYTNYLYGEVNEVQGFYKSSGSGTVAAGKAYLQLPTAAVSGARVAISFDDETTGISNANANVNLNEVYDLRGRKVADEFNPKRLPAGVYIVDGKKVVVKK